MDEFFCIGDTVEIIYFDTSRKHLVEQELNLPEKGFIREHVQLGYAIFYRLVSVVFNKFTMKREPCSFDVTCRNNVKVEVLISLTRAILFEKVLTPINTDQNKYDHVRNRF